ncbi:hypothetical protein FF80_03006 [Devosia sp. LC5]|uniref:hypothetical protein n=1 Tax=Devosia sp. LC5 TaxID=1502724 RepID=UPI0004E33AC2|nr:hypothetical protein [Devosia sp. LC5]KFC64384.1 hypothetical protein FF80_03006 [Devosia sp. LC5]
MKIPLAAALLLAATSAALGFDSRTQGIIDDYKSGKLIRIADVAHLMASSERWCYVEEEGTCSWSDIYLDVDKSGAEFEIGNAWDQDIDIAFTDRGEFRDGRYICETGLDWVPAVRATKRSDGSAIGGRELAQLKSEIAGLQSDESKDCFDYLFVSADAENQTLKLTQRQYIDDIHDTARDTEVTIHFDEAAAKALSYRW